MTRTSALRKSYVDGLYGQVHLLTGGQERASQPPLYMLHATAYSGRTFSPLMEKLSDNRIVHAPDTPGYGGSDRPSKLPDLGGYAEAFIDLVSKTSGLESGPVDVFGYHTGVFVALEAAAQRPELFRSIILIGVPHYLGSEREARRAVLAEQTKLTEDFEQFRARWEYFIRDRTPGLSLPRAFECFVDELRAYPNQWWAHEALFTYDTVSSLERVACPVLILNPNSPLSGPSRAAAKILKNVEFIELPTLSGAIFDLEVEQITERVEDFLNRQDR
ncbi:MAG: alpha/beta hydrolase [Rhodospirillaceae bacterium]